MKVQAIIWRKIVWRYSIWCAISEMVVESVGDEGMTCDLFDCGKHGSHDWIIELIEQRCRIPLWSHNSLACTFHQWLALWALRGQVNQSDSVNWNIFVNNLTWICISVWVL